MAPYQPTYILNFPGNFPFPSPIGRSRKTHSTAPPLVSLSFGQRRAEKAHSFNHFR
jgi:hypothetical protein